MSRALDEAVDRLARACSNFGQMANLSPAAPLLNNEGQNEPWPSLRPPLRPEEAIEPSPAVVEDNPPARPNLRDRSQPEETSFAPPQPAITDQRKRTEDEFAPPTQSDRGPIGKVLAWVRGWFGAN